MRRCSPALMLPALFTYTELGSYHTSLPSGAPLTQYTLVRCHATGRQRWPRGCLSLRRPRGPESGQRRVLWLPAAQHPPRVSCRTPQRKEAFSDFLVTTSFLFSFHFSAFSLKLSAAREHVLIRTCARTAATGTAGLLSNRTPYLQTCATSGHVFAWFRQEQGTRGLPLLSKLHFLGEATLRGHALGILHRLRMISNKT